MENYRDEELLFKNHRRIYEGISKNDPILAYEEMKRNMENIRESYIKTIS